MMQLARLFLMVLHLYAADGMVVDHVEIEGLKRIDQDTVLAVCKLHAGALYTADMATLDLRAIWHTGFFRDIRIDTIEHDHRVVVKIIVVEKPSVEVVAYTGYDSVSEDDIKNLIDIKPHTILNVDTIRRNVDKIKDLYVSKGYYLAEVNYRIDTLHDKEEDVSVTFEIAEHAKVEVRQISFLGNKFFNAARIKSAMQTQEGSEISFLTQAGTYKEEFFQTDLYRIQALYFDHGFVSVKMGEPIATISKDRLSIYLTIPIEEGPQYRVGAITFATDMYIDEAILRRNISLQPNAVFNRSLLFNDLQSITDLYRDQGYAYANITPNSKANPDNQTIDLELDLDRGEMIYFERIDIIGNIRTRDKVVRRELSIVEGDTYSAAALNLSRARVYQLGYFETVNITTARGSNPNLMVATVEIKEKSTGTFQVGAALSNSDGFIATAQISQNNFLGNGQLLALSAQLSFGEYARQLANFQFYEPYFLDTPLSLGINAYINQRNYGDFQRNAKGVAPMFGYALGYDMRVSMGYTFENVNISTANATYPSVLYNLSRSGYSSAVNGSISYDTRNNRLAPSAGLFNELRFAISSALLGSDGGLIFKRLEFDLRFYQPLFWQFVFKTNMQLGWVFGAQGGVPISERYFPGGIMSIRGFPVRGLGPTIRVASNRSDPSAETRDFVIGGNKQAIFNFEIEFPIIEPAGLKGVLFADAGNAYNDDEDAFYLNTPAEQQAPAFLAGSNRQITAPLGLFYAVGFGVRWQSPIGPLRFEWGIPITKHAIDDPPIIFEFTIGNFF